MDVQHGRDQIWEWKAKDVIESGGGPQAEDMMTLPPLPPLVLEGDEDFEDDRLAWKKRTRLNPEEYESDTDGIDGYEVDEDMERWFNSATTEGGTSQQGHRVSLGSAA